MAKRKTTTNRQRKASPRKKTAAKKKTAKRKAKRKSPAERKPADIDALYPVSLDRAILMLVSGSSRAETIAAATAEQWVPSGHAETLVDLAIDRIAVAADYDRRREIGRSVRRLNALYAMAAESKDVKSGVAVQKELNRLLDLYPHDSADVHAEEAAQLQDVAEKLAAVAGHLLPLALAPADYPVEEHARIAAAQLRQAK